MDWAAAVASANGIIRDTYSLPVVYTPQTGVAVALDAIFGRPYIADPQVDPAIVSATAPYLDVVLSDLSPVVPSHGDTCSIGGSVYQVTDAQPNGHGTMRLTLVEV